MGTRVNTTKTRVNNGEETNTTDEYFTQTSNTNVQSCHKLAHKEGCIWHSGSKWISENVISLSLN